MRGKESTKWSGVERRLIKTNEKNKAHELAKWLSEIHIFTNKERYSFWFDESRGFGNSLKRLQGVSELVN